MSAREWRRATEATLGANGSCTWTKSSVRGGQHVLDGARDVDRRRRAGAAAERQRLADGQHAHPAVGVEEQLGLLARGADQPARLADALGRARRREHDHAVAAGGELARQLAREGVDLVLVLPGEGRDLRDREPLEHRRHRSRRCARGRISRRRRTDPRRPSRGPPAAASAALRVRACFAMNVLGRLARQVVRALVVRRLHEVRGRTVELPGDAVVEGELDAADRVDDDAGGVRGVPDLELELGGQRDVAERRRPRAGCGPTCGRSATARSPTGRRGRLSGASSSSRIEVTALVLEIFLDSRRSRSSML